MFRVGILTVSDKGHAGERHDASGPELARLLPAADFQVAAAAVVPDELEAITAQLLSWCDRERLDLILTTGGTGLSPRDRTPEATLAVAQRAGAGPARGHAGRRPGQDPPRHALPGGGVSGGDPILNLPGSPKGARKTWPPSFPPCLTPWRNWAAARRSAGPLEERSEAKPKSNGTFTAETQRAQRKLYILFLRCPPRLLR